MSEAGGGPSTDRVDESAAAAAAAAAAVVPNSSRLVGGGVHLVSWNVASWKRSLERIGRFCGGLQVKQAASNHSETVPDTFWLSPIVQSWMAELGVDILCLQETKLTTNEVANDPGEFVCVFCCVGLDSDPKDRIRSESRRRESRGLRHVLVLQRRAWVAIEGTQRCPAAPSTKRIAPSATGTAVRSSLFGGLICDRSLQLLPLFWSLLVSVVGTLFQTCPARCEVAGWAVCT